ncbi:MAG TPA: competence/damage-inducible protein A [Firmicutes bacterium]|jgi:nicotinamide-nucleotide amidase|nr:competence/damage-inducible protein A [Bacillota bacterium]
MRAEIICIGTELLLGQIVDTNAQFLAGELADLGIDLYHKTTVGDNLPRAIAVLELAWSRADLLILSGGLGPTQDDLTREAVAGLIHEELQFNEEAWNQVQNYFKKVQRPLVESNRRQAMFPKSGQVIPNHLGTAPCLLIAKENHYLIALPGVPRELKGVWSVSVQPFLKGLLKQEHSPVLTSRLIRMAGIGESAMEGQVIDLINSQTNPTLAPYAGTGEVTLRITAKGFDESANWQLIEARTAKIKERLGAFIYGYDKDNLETVVGRQLKATGWRLATAESCTGGLISHRITNVPGSSAYLLGGVNSYSNELKMKLLGVPAEVLAAHGAVSPETAQAMAEGIRKLTGAEAGVAATGIAGPDGGSETKPVGLVYLAVVLPGVSRVEKKIFGYDRLGNKEAAAQAGLTLLWQSLKELGY